ncbi:MAG: transporter substrate-binding domain-containing protein [Chloroflexi bacterium]|nr:transporter substrate-binding domain-containing protein [Chloroflexota bacterium]
MPTLMVPTLVPVIETGTPVDALPSISAVADIIDSSVFRVGVLYNDPPYSELTLRGEVSGFAADLLRKIANVWSSEIEFLQVTRLNALDKLNSGEVHAVASGLVRYRDLDAALDFSQTYLRGKQALMVSASSAYTAPVELSDQTIGYVLGSRTEKALDIWRNRLGRDLNLRPFLTLDRAVAALTRAEIAGLVAEEQALLRLAADAEDNVRLLDQPVVSESHAIAVRRQDAPMRLLLNHTLQFLANDGEIDVLFREYFPDATYNGDVITLWSGIGDQVSLDQYPAALHYPTSYALPRIKSRGVLRVGGLTDASQAATAGLRRLAELNLALVSEIASRWNVRLELVPTDPETAAQSLNSGAVDLVVGLKPDWAAAAAVEFSAPYLLHGDRLMVRTHSGIHGFSNLRGRIVGILIGDGSAQERAEAWADSINATVRFFRTTESGAAQTILDFNNANAIYADSLALLSHLEENPNSLRLTDRWYSRSFYSFALPYNDPDIRLLLDYTIQELIVDGTLYRLTAPLLVSDELPDFEIIPGMSRSAGINLSRAEADSEP